MSNSFGYLDIILLGMIAGFIILRLRSILGRKTGHDSKVYPNFAEKKFSMPQKETKAAEQNLEILLAALWQAAQRPLHATFRPDEVCPVENHLAGNTSGHGLVAVRHWTRTTWSAICFPRHGRSSHHLHQFLCT